jgi:Fic family protein
MNAYDCSFKEITKILKNASNAGIFVTNKRLPRGKLLKLDDEKVAKFRKTMSVDNIAKMLNCSSSSINKLLKRYRESVQKRK